MTDTSYNALIESLVSQIIDEAQLDSMSVDVYGKRIDSYHIHASIRNAVGELDAETREELTRTRPFALDIPDTHTALRELGINLEHQSAVSFLTLGAKVVLFWLVYGELKRGKKHEIEKLKEELHAAHELGDEVGVVYMTEHLEWLESPPQSRPQFSSYPGSDPDWWPLIEGS